MRGLQICSHLIHFFSEVPLLLAVIGRFKMQYIHCNVFDIVGVVRAEGQGAYFFEDMPSAGIICLLWLLSEIAG